MLKLPDCVFRGRDHRIVYFRIFVVRVDLLVFLFEEIHASKDQ